MRPADSPRNDQKLANRTKTYGPPSLQAILRSGLVHLRQRIRSQTIGPGQDGDSRVPLLINFTASKHTGTRFPGRRSMVRPSRFHHQQTSLAFAFRKRSAYSASKRYRAGIEVSLRRNTAQATRASLLAKATTATFLGTRGVSARSHATPGPWRKQCAAASQNYVRNFRAIGVFHAATFWEIGSSVAPARRHAVGRAQALPASDESCPRSTPAMRNARSYFESNAESKMSEGSAGQFSQPLCCISASS
jgi:hypothetical protein